MPGGDRTGPMGMGARTGRGSGYCSGMDRPGFANPVSRRGLGMGAGRGIRFRGQGGGRGWRNWFYAAGGPGAAPWGPYGEPAPAAVSTMGKDTLKKQAEVLQSQLDAIRKQLADLEE
jgi:hypothetical protein